MGKQMTEQQAWEKLYGRRTPDVRVLGRYAADDDVDEREPERPGSPAPRAGQGDSEAHAA
jgi:DNA helicase HerA-like ATPase